jgi:hypothetical protein
MWAGQTYPLLAGWPVKKGRTSRTATKTASVAALGRSFILGGGGASVSACSAAAEAGSVFTSSMTMRCGAGPPSCKARKAARDRSGLPAICQPGPHCPPQERLSG